jgi:hypothetical protein
MQQFDEAVFYVRDAVLTCVRPVFDPQRQEPMLLVTSTDRVWGGSGK